MPLAAAWALQAPPDPARAKEDLTLGLRGWSRLLGTFTPNTMGFSGQERALLKLIKEREKKEKTRKKNLAKREKLSMLSEKGIFSSAPKQKDKCNKLKHGGVFQP